MSECPATGDPGLRTSQQPIEATLCGSDEVQGCLRDDVVMRRLPKNISNQLNKSVRDAHPNAGTRPVQPMANQAGTETTLL